MLPPAGYFCHQRQKYPKSRLKLRFKTSLARGQAGVVPAGASWGVSCSGTSTLAVHNFRQPNQRFGASVVFFCKKKGTKENHLDLRSKDPLARYGSCKIGGADLAELVRRVSLSVWGTACTSCAAAADNREGRGWCAGRVANIKSRLCRRKAAKVGVPVGHRI